ncbi:GNAT family N-acetyltransferase [Streptomyces piniterrae]|uniref:GNAT family N-acetyltransferase n=1 Tax=Streptomyces piniterrae TaxID=2571125 RepID=A0A4U0NXG1_9ACTN|nr:GNAT family N-acetyltransferase [Streptomyces piniterrae]TJZ59370.1 GNAT family N-acetyltransferase [Streptomyces piniterrae]
MDVEAVRALFDRQMRREATADSPGARVERDGDVVRQVGGADDWNGVVWSDLDGSTADAAIAAQVRHFTSLGREFEWKVYAHDRPADLGERLRTAGFTAEPAEALMVAPVRGLRAAGADFGPPEGARLLPVADAAGVELLVRVHEEVFGRPGARLRHRLLGRLAEDPGSVAMVVAMAGDLPVSAARIELTRGNVFAGLWGGGTLPAWRGRGLYRALVAHRAWIAEARNFSYLQVDASDQSRPILERLGFSTLSTTTPYLYTGPTRPAR